MKIQYKACLVRFEQVWKICHKNIGQANLKVEGNDLLFFSKYDEIMFPLVKGGGEILKQEKAMQFQSKQFW